MRSGATPPLAFGAGVSCAAAALGDGDAVSEDVEGGDGVALGGAVVGSGVGASVGAGVGGAVGAIVGGAVRTGVGGAVGGAVGCGVVTAWTSIVPCMNAWIAQ